VGVERQGSCKGIITPKLIMTEKKAMERATAEAFLALYNKKMNASFTINEHLEAPDIRCEDSNGNKLNLEITSTEDFPSTTDVAGDIQATYRDNKVPCVGGFDGACDTLFQRICAKAKKDYGSDVALVIQNFSGVGWCQEIAEKTKERFSNLLEKLDPSFDKGIWLIACGRNEIFLIYMKTKGASRD